jgi:hypothetical protein
VSGEEYKAMPVEPDHITITSPSTTAIVIYPLYIHYYHYHHHYHH